MQACQPFSGSKLPGLAFPGFLLLLVQLQVLPFDWESFYKDFLEQPLPRSEIAQFCFKWYRVIGNSVHFAMESVKFAQRSRLGIGTALLS